MAKRSRRADEIIPKLHYRPGVEDADLEATIVGFYGKRDREDSLAPKKEIEDSTIAQTPPVIETPVVMTPVETPRHITTPVDFHRRSSLQSAADTLQQIAALAPNLITTPVETTPKITTPVVSQSRPYNVHRAVLAQDGHSHTEQLLYDILWRSGKGVAGDSYRLVQIPQSELASAIRMTTKNLRIALDRLVEKLALEEVQAFDRGNRVARTWKVYSYRLILERRKAAGMEWVIRDRGVRYVDPRTIPVKPTRVVMPEDGVTTGVKSAETTGVNAVETTPVKTTPPFLGQVSREPYEQTSTDVAPVSPVIATALIDAFGFIDNEALKTLVKKCRENAPDAADEEIAELGAMTARRVARMRNINNSVGLLISQTARCFQGEPFAIYRHEREERERRFAAEFPKDQS